MTKISRVLIALASAALFLASCKTVPVTGRKQLSMVSDAELVKMTTQAFEQMKASMPTAKPSIYTDMVQRVGERIAQEVFWDVPLAEWEFVLFDSKEINAFAMPGGKVGIFMGLFKIVRTEDELASVMAHEIAHVTAQHTHERLSQQNLMGMGGNVLAIATSAVNTGPIYVSPNSILGIYNIGTQGTVVAWDREKEAEADHIGIIYMARAGYNPSAAIAVMERMVEMEAATAQETYNATHPSSAERLNALHAYLDEAMVVYEKAKEFHF